NQAYAIAVLDDAWAAPALDGILIHQGRARHDLNFSLIAGTVLEGRVTAGPKKEPATGELIYLTYQGAPLGDELGNDLKGVRTNLSWWANVGADGRYHARVGPGDYKIAGPDMKYVEFRARGEAMLVQDFHVPRLSEVPLAVTVRRPDGSPAAGVDIQTVII